MFSCASFPDFRYLINLRYNVYILIVLLFSVYVGIYSYPLKAVLDLLFGNTFIFFLSHFARLIYRKISHHYMAIIYTFLKKH